MRHMNTALIGLELRRRQMKALCFRGIWIGALVLVMGPAIALAQGIPVQQKICWDGTEDSEVHLPDGVTFKCNSGEFPENSVGRSEIDVPTNNTLMIEYISMRCFASDAQTAPVAMVLFTAADGVYDEGRQTTPTVWGLHRFQLDLRGSNRRGEPFYWVGQETRVYAKGQQWGPGGTKEVRVLVAVQGPGYVTCAGTVSGQLIPSV